MILREVTLDFRYCKHRFNAQTESWINIRIKEPSVDLIVIEGFKSIWWLATGSWGYALLHSNPK